MSGITSLHFWIFNKGYRSVDKGAVGLNNCKFRGWVDRRLFYQGVPGTRILPNKKNGLQHAKTKWARGSFEGRFVKFYILEITAFRDEFRSLQVNRFSA